MPMKLISRTQKHVQQQVPFKERVYRQELSYRFKSSDDLLKMDGIYMASWSIF